MLKRSLPAALLIAALLAACQGPPTQIPRTESLPQASPAPMREHQESSEDLLKKLEDLRPRIQSLPEAQQEMVGREEHASASFSTQGYFEPYFSPPVQKQYRITVTWWDRWGRVVSPPGDSYLEIQGVRTWFRPSVAYWDGTNWQGKMVADGPYYVKLYGFGRQQDSATLTVDATPPTVSNVKVALDPEDVTGKKFVITATITDAGAGTSPESLNVAVSGADATGAQFALDPATGQMDYRAALSPTFQLASAGGTDAEPDAASTPPLLGCGIAVADKIGNAITNKSTNDLPEVFSVSELTLSRNTVRPLRNWEYTYQNYSDAVVEVKAWVKNQFGRLRSNIPVRLDSARKADSGGHEHIEGPTGCFSLSGLFDDVGSYNFANTEARFTGNQVADKTISTNGKGVASLRYRPYGFAGSEQISAQLPDKPQTRRARDLTIALPGLVKFKPGDIALTDIESHPGEGLHGTEETVEALTAACTKFKKETGRRFTVGGISLSTGGPFDIYKDWLFTHAGSHKGHREGNEVDISTKPFATNTLDFHKIYRSDIYRNYLQNKKKFKIIPEGYNSENHWHLRKL